MKWKICSLRAALNSSRMFSIWTYRSTCDKTNNAELSTDQDIRTRDSYHTVDKAIRHKMSNVSSADGHYRQRKLKEKWGKSRERAVFPNAFCMCSNRKWKRGESWVSGGSWDSNLMVRKWGDHRENRSLARLPPLLLQFSLSIVPISRWNIRHFVSNRFVDSVVTVPCPYILIRTEFRIVSLCKLENWLQHFRMCS